jgi:hypothetical protein
MKSRITIEVDFDTAIPYIRILHDRMSDDVRDKLITQFRHKLGYTSSWARIKFDDCGLNGIPLFEIHPILPSELPTEIDLIRERIAGRELI